MPNSKLLVLLLFCLSSSAYHHHLTILNRYELYEARRHHLMQWHARIDWGRFARAASFSANIIHPNTPLSRAENRLTHCYPKSIITSTAYRNFNWAVKQLARLARSSVEFSSNDSLPLYLASCNCLLGPIRCPVLRTTSY